MNLTKSKLIKYVLIGITAVVIASFWLKKEEKTKASPRDYPAIETKGILRVVTEYNSISFYVDGDTLSGFYYELIQAFARDHELETKITPEMSFEKRLRGLEDGKFDIIAYGIPTTSELKDSLLLTTPILLSKQILVQRKNDVDSIYIKSQIDLANKTLYVEKGSPSILRIRNLGNEIADTIYIKEMDKYGPEQLIAMVAHGDIDYAVADEAIARASIDSFPQLDINTGISFTQFFSWGVNKHSPVLLDSINSWLDNFVDSKEYKRIYKKYFK